MTRENLAECKPVNLAHLGIKERADLQHVLRDHIEVLDSDLRVIAEEYGNWEDSRRRIDPARPRQAAAPGLEDPTAIEETLRGQGVNAPERYFLDAPFTQDGKAFVLSKMWGAARCQPSRPYETPSRRPELASRQKSKSTSRQIRTFPINKT
jgi:hypothetical protein